MRAVLGRPVVEVKRLNNSRALSVAPGSEREPVVHMWGAWIYVVWIWVAPVWGVSGAR